MGDYSQLINLLNDKNEEKLRKNFLKSKGYGDPSCEDFGLNQWTCRLQSDVRNSQTEIQPKTIITPDHFVSFLLLPSYKQDEIIDTNSQKLRDWISQYPWIKLPYLDSPFSTGHLFACSNGLIRLETQDYPSLQKLDQFLVLSRNGVIEYGVGRGVVLSDQNEVYFSLIHIVGRLWQFLLFNEDLFKEFLIEHIDQYYLYINIRGTQNALMGGLAEGWRQPYTNIITAYSPRCVDNNLQIVKKIQAGLSQPEIEDTVHWFATRIDNAWGQFEPRCYVHKNINASQPFAFNK